MTPRKMGYPCRKVVVEERGVWNNDIEVLKGMILRLAANALNGSLLLHAAGALAWLFLVYRPLIKLASSL